MSPGGYHVNSLSEQNINSFPIGTVPCVAADHTEAKLNPTLLAEVMLFPCLLSLVPALRRSCSGMSVSLPFLERQRQTKESATASCSTAGVWFSCPDASGLFRTLAKLICAIESHSKSQSVLHPSIFHQSSSAPNITTLLGTALS